MMPDCGQKGNVHGMSYPDPMDRIKNDSGLYRLSEFAKSKMNYLKLIKGKGGHSYPSILWNGFRKLLCSRFCPLSGLAMGEVFGKRSARNCSRPKLQKLKIYSADHLYPVIWIGS
jgi:hypothetical protein